MLSCAAAAPRCQPAAPLVTALCTQRLQACQPFIAACSSSRRRQVVAAAPNDGDGGDAGAAPQASQENFLDYRTTLQEARSQAEDFVFEWDEDEEEEEDNQTLNLFEERMAAQAAAEAASGQTASASGDMPLTAQTADVLSAYSAEQGFKEITVDKLQELRGPDGSGIALLDVRTPEEYGNGHAVGAVNVPLDQLTAAVKGGQLPPAHEQIALICQSGRRSAQAAVKLARVHGFSDVINVQGGTLAWVAAGLPTES